jgi:thymidylate kinase
VSRGAPAEIFLTGIDGSGKSAALDSLISRLDGRYRILSNGDELYVHFKGQKNRASKWGLHTVIDRLKGRPRYFPLRGLLSLLSFAARCFEAAYLKRYGNIDLLLYETDTVLHPAAFSAFHFPWIRRIDRGVRLKILQALFGPPKNSLTFYLDTDFHTANDRIVRRSKAPDPHENVRDLEILKREFDDVVRIASVKDTRIIRINTNNRSIDAVVNEMETALKEKLAIC